MNHRIVRLREVQRMMGLSRSTIHALIAKGHCPQQVHPARVYPHEMATFLRTANSFFTEEVQHPVKESRRPRQKGRTNMRQVLVDGFFEGRVQCLSHIG